MRRALCRYEGESVPVRCYFVAAGTRQDTGQVTWRVRGVHIFGELVCNHLWLTPTPAMLQAKPGYNYRLSFWAQVVRYKRGANRHTNEDLGLAEFSRFQCWRGQG